MDGGGERGGFRFFEAKISGADTNSFVDWLCRRIVEIQVVYTYLSQRGIYQTGTIIHNYAYQRQPPSPSTHTQLSLLR